MKEFYWHGGKLKEEIMNMQSVNKLSIATAFFSLYGLNLVNMIALKNSLPKTKIEIFLSPEFSCDNPSELLIRLDQFATVYIVSKLPFHAKVYYFEGADSKLIFGSSNLTKGGIENNIEFDLLLDEVSNDEKVRLSYFFDYCRNNSTLLNHNIINMYLKNEEEFKQLKMLQKKLKKKLFEYETQSDPFDDDEYDLEDYYFDFSDYETLFQRNWSRADSDIKARRKTIQSKLLDIHNITIIKIRKMGLDCHWRPDNITSLINPCVFNKHVVTWVGIRYGSKVIKEFARKLDPKDAAHGFQKYACLQFNLNRKGFEVCLFHAVPHDAVDRSYVYGKLSDKIYKQKIINEIEILKGYGLVWHIYDESIECPLFEFDTENAKDFIEFYMKNDQEGRESYLSYFVAPNDCRLKNEESISKLVIEMIEVMKPLYNVMANTNR